MPIHPIGSKKATLKKSPHEGNNARFSNGKDTVDIIAWELKNSRITNKTTPYTKVYNQDTTFILQTYSNYATELEVDDVIVWDRAYVVQSVKPLETPMGGICKKIYQISLK